MTTVEKMHQIQKLMNEVESEVREIAKSIEDIDAPLYRMLTEGCADYYKTKSKDYNSLKSGNQVDVWTMQLNHAYKLINGLENK